ncbi:MAG: hypothetical protein WBE22_11685 [Halobacteriota archaeon]
MTKNENTKQYDLEERTLEFAKEEITFVKIPESESERNALIDEATQLTRQNL